MKLKILSLLILFFIISYISHAATYTVTSTSDSGANTLRWAVNQVNASTGPHTILFNIAGTGPQTITLLSNLPNINNTVFIDGTSQGGNYQIIITANNSLNVGRVFQFEPGSEFSEVKGIHFKDLSMSGVFCYANDVSVTDNMFHNIGHPSATWSKLVIGVFGNRCIVTGNIIGTDPTMTQNYGSTIGRGIYVQHQYLSADDCIIGGSNPGDANIVANMYAGITIDNAVRALISENIIFNISAFSSIHLVPAGINTVDGNILKPAPVITGAEYCNGTITIYGTADPYDLVELFGSTGTENANEYLANTTADAVGNWTIVLNSLNWNFLVATATDNVNNTSQLSAAYQVFKNNP